MHIPADVQADNLKKVFVNLFIQGREVKREAEKRFMFERAYNEAQQAGVRPDDIVIRDISRTVTNAGRQISGHISLLAVKFGEGDATAWTALLWFQRRGERSGWVEVVRIFTKDTAKMPWLEAEARKW